MPNGTSHCSGQWCGHSNIDFQHQISRFQTPTIRNQNVAPDNHATSPVRAGGVVAPKLLVQIIILHFLPQDFVLETLWKGGEHEKIT